VKSAHDVSEGGLFVTLAESAFHRNLGFQISNESGIRTDAWLFGESQGRVVVSASTKNLEACYQVCRQMEVPCLLIGRVSHSDVVIDGKYWNHISYWKEKYDTAIGNLLTTQTGEQALSMI